MQMYFIPTAYRQVQENRQKCSGCVWNLDMAQKVHVFLAAIPPYYRLISIRKVKQDIFVIIQVYPDTQHEGLVFYGDVHSRAR